MKKRRGKKKEEKIKKKVSKNNNNNNSKDSQFHRKQYIYIYSEKGDIVKLQCSSKNTIFLDGAASP